MEKTNEMNGPDYEERIDGLYPTPDGKVYLAIWKEKRDGEHTFYAVDDDCAIKYANGIHSNPSSLEEVVFSYRKVEELLVGMKVSVPLGAYDILLKCEDEDWGLTGKLLHIEHGPLEGILLHYADHPDYAWNTYIPDKDLIIEVPERMIKGRTIK